MHTHGAYLLIRRPHARLPMHASIHPCTRMAHLTRQRHARLPKTERGSSLRAEQRPLTVAFHRVRIDHRRLRFQSRLAPSPRNGCTPDQHLQNCTALANSAAVRIAPTGNTTPWPPKIACTVNGMCTHHPSEGAAACSPACGSPRRGPHRLCRPRAGLRPQRVSRRRRA